MTTATLQETSTMPRSVLRHRPIDPEQVRTASMTLRATRNQQRTRALPRRSFEVQQTRTRVMKADYWPLIVCLSMFATLLLLSTVQNLSGWISTTLDDMQYGRPRTYQTDAFVGHEANSQPSHFVVLNLKGRIQVIELPGGDAKNARIFLGPQLYGPAAERIPATLQFVDPQHTRKPDMLIHVQGSQVRLRNVAGTFQP